MLNLMKTGHIFFPHTLIVLGVTQNMYCGAQGPYAPTNFFLFFFQQINTVFVSEGNPINNVAFQFFDNNVHQI